MKNNDQSGFILMIVILVAIVVMIIGFAVNRIISANSAEELTILRGVSTVEDESTSV